MPVTKKEVESYLRTVGLEKSTKIVDIVGDTEKEVSGDNENFNDYDDYKLKSNSFLTAPIEIKVIFSLITLDRFEDNATNDITGENLNEYNEGLELPPQSLSSTDMPMIIGTNEYWYKTKATLANVKGLDNIEKKFRNLAKYNPPLVRVYNAIFGIPNSTHDQQRLRILYESNPSPEQQRLRILFEKTFSILKA